MSGRGSEWSTKDIGDLTGTRVVVTGANSGIGYFTALALGRAGARVVLACRDARRGEEALAGLEREAPSASFRLESLDLASLASVRAFAERIVAGGEALDLLIANAGIMAVPTRETTADGFERQFGTNHLGHFALTGLLLPALARSRAPRVVTVSSGTAYFGRIRLDDLQSERSYSPTMAYAQSKLANLLFMLELGRRAPWLVSTAAHPGATHTNLQQHSGLGTRLVMAVIGQAAAEGALPSLYAAVAEGVAQRFIGPARLCNMNGPPTHVRLPKRALDERTAAALWEASEALTGACFDLRPQAQRSA